MWNRYSILAAATLAVGSAVFAGDPASNAPLNNSSANGAPTIQPSNTVEQEAQEISSTNGVQQAAAQLTQAAISGNLKDLSQYVCESDRQRINSAPDNQTPDQKLAQFRQDWHQKYGDEFSIPDAVAVLTNPDVQIQSGDLDQARTAGEKISGNSPAAKPDDSGNSLTSPRPSAAAPAGDAKINADTAQKSAAERASADIAPTPSATIIMPPNNELPTVTARFITEAEQWKIDLPNNLDGQKLQQNLDDELGKLDDQKANWSDDPKQAQLTVVHAVLAAMTDARNISKTGQSN